MCQDANCEVRFKHPQASFFEGVPGKVYFHSKTELNPDSGAERQGLQMTVMIISLTLSSVKSENIWESLDSHPWIQQNFSTMDSAEA